jgi:diguanylate cyclase (GGDEF)-like protein/PAS domain S-box-containing protein
LISRTGHSLDHQTSQQDLPPIPEDDRAEPDHIGEFESRYRMLVEQIPLMTYIQPLRGYGNLLYVSPQVEAVLGYPPSVWANNPDLVLSSIHPEDIDEWLDESQLVDPSIDELSLKHRMIRADGEIIWVRTCARIVRDQDGQPAYWQGTVEDITETVDAERRLAESEQRYRSLFEHNPDPICSFDLHGRVESANMAFSQLLGLPVEEIIGNRVEYAIPQADMDVATRAFRIAAQGSSCDFESRMNHRDGSIRDVQATLLPIVVEEDIVGVYGVFQDITERKRLEEQLTYLAFHDPLTGLPNRRLLVEHLEQMRTDPDLNPASVALMYLDLDDFKDLNDQFGHEVGDLALKELAEVIQSCVRPTDTVARLGGDEFFILLRGIEGLDHATSIANRILEHITRPRIIGGHRLSISASIGIVTNINPEDTPDVLLRRGDKSMYRAKEDGKARFRVHGTGRLHG